MAIDMRVKGCPNKQCKMHKDHKKQKATMNYCPACGSKLIFVCAKCFDEIEDRGPSHRICDFCEAKKSETRAKVEDIAEKVKDKAGVVVLGIATVAVGAFTKALNGDVAKAAGDLAHDVVDKLGDVIKK